MISFGPQFGAVGVGMVFMLYGGESAPGVIVPGPYCFTVMMKTAGPSATLVTTAGAAQVMAKTAGPVAVTGGCGCGG